MIKDNLDSSYIIIKNDITKATTHSQEVYYPNMIMLFFSEENDQYNEEYHYEILQIETKEDQCSLQSEIGDRHIANLTASETNRTGPWNQELENEHQIMYDRIDELLVNKNNMVCTLARQNSYEIDMKAFEELYSLVKKSLKARMIFLLLLNNLLWLAYKYKQFNKIIDFQNYFQTIIPADQLSSKEIEASGKTYFKILDNYGKICLILSQYKYGKLYIEQSKLAYEASFSIKSQLLSENDLLLAKSLENIGVLLFRQMQFEKALEKFQKAIAIIKIKVGDSNIEIARLMSYVSQCYRSLSNHEASLNFEKQSLEIKETIHKQNDTMYPSLLDSLLSLGEIFYDYQDLNEAYNYAMKAKAIIERSPEISTNRLAKLYILMGLIQLSQDHFEKAFDNFKKAIKILKNIYGDTHLEIALCLGYFARYYQQLENFETALEYSQKKREMIFDIFGDDDSHMASAYKEISDLYAVQGLFDKSQEYLEKTLQITKNFFGETSQFAADIYVEIGSIHFKDKKVILALEYFSKALEIYQKQLGEHNKVAITLEYLSRCFPKRKDYNKGLDYALKGLEMKKKIFSEDHICVGESYQTLGDFYSAKEEYEEAIKYYQKAAEVFEKRFGENHSTICVLCNSIGNVYYSMEEIEQALQFYEKSVSIKEEIFGSESFPVASGLLFIAKIHEENFNQEASILNYCKALEIYEKLLGEKHIKIADLCDKIAGAEYLKLNFDEAIQRYQKALEIRRSLFGKDSLIFADSLYNIAKAYRRKHSFNDTINYCVEALVICVKLFGENHLKVAEIYDTIAQAYEGQRMYEEALSFFNKSLKIREKELGKKHRLVIQLNHDIARVFFCKGNYQEALRSFFTLLKIYENVYGRTNIKASFIHDTIAEIYKASKDFQNANHHYSIAFAIELKLLGPNQMTNTINFLLTDLRRNMEKLTILNNSI